MRKLMRTFWVSIFILALPMTAVAQECESDDDCAEGELCLFDPCPECPPGPDCPPCDPNGQCEEQVDPWEALLCETDNDCPVSFSCKTREVGCDEESTPIVVGVVEPTEDEQSSSGSDSDADGEDASSDAAMPPSQEEGGDDEGGEKGIPEEEDCEPETISVCAFDPQICESDDECAENFECLPLMEECSSMGSSGSTGGAASDCVCPDCACAEGDEDCECPPCDCPEEPVEEKEEEVVFEEDCEVTMLACFPKETACATDDDCPESWECIEAPKNDIAVSIDCPPCECEPGDEECVCPDCEEEEIPEPEQSEGMCMPEGWADLFGSMGGMDYGDSTGFNESAPVSGDSDKGNDLGTGDEAGESAMPNPEDDGDVSDVEESADSGGCHTIASASDSANLLLLALFFVLMVMSNRRRQQQ